MADVTAPQQTIIKEGNANVAAVGDFQQRRLVETELLNDLQSRLHQLDSTPDGRGRGFEIR